MKKLLAILLSLALLLSMSAFSGLAFAISSSAGPLSVTGPSDSVSPGDQIQLTVTITSTALHAGAVSLNFDSDVLSIVKTGSRFVLPALTEDEEDDGVLMINQFDTTTAAAAFTTGISGAPYDRTYSGNFFRVNMKVADNASAGSTLVTFSFTLEGAATNTYSIACEVTVAGTEASCTHESLTPHAAVTPDCVNGGNSAYWECDSCHKIFSDAQGTNETTIDAVTLPASGHSMNHYTAVSATCTGTGNIEYWKCSVCQKYFSNAQGTTEITAASVTTSALGHILTLVPAVNATCTTGGHTAYYTCSRCQNWYADALATTLISNHNSVNTPANGHSMTHFTAVAATCTGTGNIEYWKCSVCQKYFSNAQGTTEITAASVTTSALGHILTLVPAVNATCTTGGHTAYYTCSRCQNWYADALATTLISNHNSVNTPANGHSLTHYTAVAATCSATGNTEYWKCTVCQNYFSNAQGTNATTLSAVTTAIDPDAHAYGQWQQVTAPTCTGKGSKQRVCTHNAEHVDTDDIDPLGHNLTLVPAVNATCTTGGHTAYYTCSRCTDWFSDSRAESIIANHASVNTNALDHDLKQVDALLATCTEAGHNAYEYCTRCDYTTRVDEPATGHDLHKVDAVEATPEATGTMEHYKCGNCQELFLDDAGTQPTTLDELTTYYQYEVAEGDAFQYVKGGGTALSVTSKSKKDAFTGVLVDGNEVDPANYEVEQIIDPETSEESTKITFTAAFVSGLAIGAHQVTVLSGAAEANTTVTFVSSNITPPTGGMNMIVIWMILLILTVSGIAFVLVYGRKLRRN